MSDVDGPFVGVDVSPRERENLTATLVHGKADAHRDDAADVVESAHEVALLDDAVLLAADAACLLLAERLVCLRLGLIDLGEQVVSLLRGERVDLCREVNLP